MTWEGVSLHDLADRGLEIQVWDHDRLGEPYKTFLSQSNLKTFSILGQNELAGGIRLNLGSGKHAGKPSAWMDAGGNEAVLWQQMLDRPNFWVEGAVSVRAPERMNSTHAPL